MLMPEPRLWRFEFNCLGCGLDTEVCKRFPDFIPLQLKELDLPSYVKQKNKQTKTENTYETIIFKTLAIRQRMTMTPK